MLHNFLLPSPVCLFLFLIKNDFMRLLVLSFLLFCVTAGAQEKKKITHEDLWLMKRVGAPRLSADGKWVVFSVTEPGYDEKRNNSGSLDRSG